MFQAVHLWSLHKRIDNSSNFTIRIKWPIAVHMTLYYHHYLNILHKSRLHWTLSCYAQQPWQVGQVYKLVSSLGVHTVIPGKHNNKSFHRNTTSHYLFLQYTHNYLPPIYWHVTEWACRMTSICGDNVVIILSKLSCGIGSSVVLAHNH